jgi:hypothetical protein
MPAIRSTSEIAEKWSRVTPQRRQDYQAGVQNPRRDWSQATIAAESAWAQGVQEAAAGGRFGRGVQQAGTQKWQRKTIDLGVNRWPEGVARSAPDFQAGFDKFRQIISNTQLPPRGPKGSPQNIERVRVMAAALHDAKVRGS